LLSKEIKKIPNNPQAFYTRAVVYVRMRRYDMAAADYKEVLKLVPTGKIADLAKLDWRRSTSKKEENSLINIESLEISDKDLV